MNKWQYIRLISESGDHYGDRLVCLMDCYKVQSLRELTTEQVEAYYEKIMAAKPEN